MILTSLYLKQQSATVMLWIINNTLKLFKYNLISIIMGGGNSAIEYAIPINEKQKG